ncbi:MAG: T9SS type A sorting domain-containing protein [Calditrichaeota bacterium]|nr:T9SS type A sorting domain-containing protein [Calditrichota bacterium]MBT7788758.1 T9SS type A sorting domain-containing protein [Calditrichota bacterium]
MSTFRNILIWLLLLHSLVSAQTHVGGMVSGRWTQEGSPYICDQNGAWGFGIAGDDTLIIDPGVTVLFADGRTGIDCWGVLIAEGTEEDSITFDIFEGENWFGIVLMDTSWDDIEIKNISFSYCKFVNWRPLNQFGRLTNLVTVGSNDHKPVFRNCFFQGRGPVITSGFQVEMYHCRFSNVEQFGLDYEVNLETRLPETSVISHCVFEIALNCGCIRVGPRSSVIVSNCLFYPTGPGYPIVATDSCQIKNNIFMGSGSMISLEYRVNPDAPLPQISNNLFFNQREDADLILHGEIELDEFGVNNRVNANGDSTDVFGNLFMDPQLVIEGEFPEMYYPTDGSPCIDAGNPDSDPDPDSTVADIGPFFFPQRNIRINPTEIEFTNTQTDLHAEESIEIRNVGLRLLNINDIFLIPEDTPFDFSFDWGEAEEILPDSLSLVWILFDPEQEGVYEAVLHIESNDRDEEFVEVNISGNALRINLQTDITPYKFGMASPYPNPFNSTTMLSYVLPNPSPISLKVFNLAGQEVQTLMGERMLAGEHKVLWNANNVPSGCYLLKLDAGRQSVVRKVNLVR